MSRPLDAILAIILIIYSIAVGTLSSMLGVGGGFINSPLLVVLFDFSLQHAPATSLGAIVFMSLSTSLVFAMQKPRPVNYKIGLGIALITIPGSIIGVLIRNALGTSVILKLIFALCLIPIAFKMFFFPKKKRKKYDGIIDEETLSFSNLEKNKMILGFIFAFIGGLSSGLLGVGGGVIVVPLLTYLGLSIHFAVATSAFTMIFTSIAGTILNLLIGGITFLNFSSVGPLSFLMPINVSPGYVHIDYVIFLAFGLVLGSQIGARFVRRVPTIRLQQIFGLVMIFPLIRISGFPDFLQAILVFWLPMFPVDDAAKLLLTFIIWTIMTIILLSFSFLHLEMRRRGHNFKFQKTTEECIKEDML